MFPLALEPKPAMEIGAPVILPDCDGPAGGALIASAALEAIAPQGVAPARFGIAIEFLPYR